MHGGHQGNCSILTVLFFFDHNVSSLLCQVPEFGLKKGSSYHWCALQPEPSPEPPNPNP